MTAHNFSVRKSIQDVWAFDRLGFPQSDHAKVTTRSDYIYEMICIWESFFPNYENQSVDSKILISRARNICPEQEYTTGSTTPRLS